MKQSPYLIQAGEFKAKCLQLMNTVNEKHITITITKHGKPIAQLAPIDMTPTSNFGCLKNTVSIKGDIISPMNNEWEANQ